MFVLVPGGTSTFREFSKHRNDLNRLWVNRFLLLPTNPRFLQSWAEATEDRGPSRVFRRQRISEDRIQQFRDAAIGEGTFGQIRREIRSRTRQSPLLRVNLQHDMNLLRGPTRDEDRRPGAQTASSGGQGSE